MTYNEKDLRRELEHKMANERFATVAYWHIVARI